MVEKEKTERIKVRESARVTKVEQKVPPSPEGMVLIKGGGFNMGDTFGEGAIYENPVHEVCVDDFYMSKCQVTVGEYREFVNDTGYKTKAEKDSRKHCWDNTKFSQTDKNPVVDITWDDASEYVKWKKKKTGLNYRLPTEAEWEYAARSGGKKENWAGTINEVELGEYAWYNGNSGRKTHPVGQKESNSLGLYDMSGNVWEWCSDWYVDFYYSNSMKDNPKGPSSGGYRVFRGGSWNDKPWFIRVSSRSWFRPDTRYLLIGFRLVLSAQ